ELCGRGSRSPGEPAHASHSHSRFLSRALQATARAVHAIFPHACKKGWGSVNLQEYKVWDATTRVFHWLNVLCVLGLIAVGTVILNADALGVPNDGKIILKT